MCRNQSVLYQGPSAEVISPYQCLPFACLSLFLEVLRVFFCSPMIRHSVRLCSFFEASEGNISMMNSPNVFLKTCYNVSSSTFYTFRYNFRRAAHDPSLRWSLLDQSRFKSKRCAALGAPSAARVMRDNVESCDVSTCPAGNDSLGMPPA